MLLADMSSRMTVVVLNKDLKKTGKRFTSLAIEISGKETWSCQQDQHTRQGRIWDDERGGRSRHLGESVCILSHYGEKDGDVIWLSTYNENVFIHFKRKKEKNVSLNK